MSTAFAFSPSDDDDDSVHPSLDASPENRVNRSAAQQGSNVPVSWRPTPREPVPVVRCTTIKSNGERCKRWSLRGATVCYRHGGSLPNVQEHAAAVVEGARLRLIGLTDLAIDQIEDLMENATQDAIRLKAAQDVLDRAGVKGAIEIDITTRQEESAVDRVRARLAEISDRMHPAEDDIVDVEIVDTTGEAALDEDD